MNTTTSFFIFYFVAFVYLFFLYTVNNNSLSFLLLYALFMLNAHEQFAVNVCQISYCLISKTKNTISF